MPCLSGAPTFDVRMSVYILVLFSYEFITSTHVSN